MHNDARKIKKLSFCKFIILIRCTLINNKYLCNAKQQTKEIII
jgi:hypothetical protein